MVEHAGLRVAAFYRFARFEDCTALCGPLARLCRSHGVKGTILLAQEGINGTIAGTDGAIGAVLDHVRSLPGCTDLDVKEARAETAPFHRLKVRTKNEIVTMGMPTIDPLEKVGHYVAPEAWNALIAEPGTILIDTRNDYEVAVGSFEGAIDPHTATFRDFPAWFREHRDQLVGDGPAPRIAMFCTGGIRCEKATAFLKAEGLDDVYHLEGGILAYLEKVAPEESRWQGECFVFDQRVTVVHGLQPGTCELCNACRMPVTPHDRASPLYASGVSCPACHAHRNDTQRTGYAERERQIGLASARGALHIGPHGGA